MSKKKTWYVIVPIGGGMDGETIEVTDSMAEVIDFCREWVYQQICDHHRNNLPLRVTEEVKRQFDIEVFKTTDTIELPFQEWADDYYRELKEGEKEDERREYERYLELKAKFEPEEE
ncbi:MAG: hypothetical protein GF334_12855 [Candidatus Altiarchaeales archaeon]|nr:hypothetical protein [Candidatus Altiarchaeales archaeon]